MTREEAYTGGQKLQTYEEGYAPRSYVQDNLNYVWKDLNSLHKTKNSSRPLDVLSAKSHVLEITDFVLRSYKETVGHQ